jgi:hypothetical protein
VTELTFADLNPGEDASLKDDDNQTITLTRYSTYPAWYFDPAIISDDYEKVVITFAEPVPDEGIQLNAESDTDGWSGTQIAALTKGASKVTAYFSAKPGVNIKSIGFYYSWNSKQGTDDQTTLKIAKVELFKKLIPNSINISVDMENGSVSADPPTAVKGDIVTLTPNPAPGYQLSKIVIEAMADTGGANARTRSVPTTGGFITATKQSNGTWSFEMPDRQVFVSAIFTIKQNNTTAIEPVGVSPQDEGTWYDLRGHRVTSLH